MEHSLYVWSGGGERWDQSTEEIRLLLKCVFRFTEKASIRMNMNINREMEVTKDPKEEITFQVLNASGKSEYRRGIPLNPNMC